MRHYLHHLSGETSIQKLIVDKSDIALLYWENKDEFSFNGEMYDLIEKQDEGNKLVLYCIPDKKETSLISEYQKLIQKNNHSQTTPSESLLQLITTHFMATDLIGLRLPDVCSNPLRYRHSFLLPHTFHTVITPPPQASC